MKILILPEDTAAKTGFTHLVIVTHEDLTEDEADTAQVIPLLDVAAGDAVFRVAVDLRQALALEGVSILGDVGDGGAADRFVPAIDVSVDTYIVKATPFVYTAADTIDLTLTPTDGALEDVEAGEIHIYLSIAKLATLSSKAGSPVNYPLTY